MSQILYKKIQRKIETGELCMPYVQYQSSSCLLFLSVDLLSNVNHMISRDLSCKCGSSVKIGCTKFGFMIEGERDPREFGHQGMSSVYDLTPTITR